jgi:pyruvate dehydrogenase E2 component (dihydrolipoamide acetyltransferase)
MPKQGQTVESCIIVEWKKQPGDSVAAGDVLCEVETDKAVLEVSSPVTGTLLARFFEAGDDVPVLTTIAAIGAAGEDVSDLRPAGSHAPAAPPSAMSAPPPAAAPAPVAADAAGAISPRARHLAERKQIDIETLQGSGPMGRIIERDVQAVLAGQPKISPVAKAMLDTGGFAAPDQGSGPGGRVMARDLAAAQLPPAEAPTPAAAPAPAVPEPGPVETIPVRGVRKVIAERMLASLQTTAQLTLHSSADARAVLALRKRLKASDPESGLQGVTINDLVLLAVARTIPRFPTVNAIFNESTITQYRDVHLGFAVDTPRGLVVPVIRHADRLGLRSLAAESKRLATAVQSGAVLPDELAGATFTVTNLGSLGVEQFTPILNAPQVAILGVGSVNLKPVMAGEDGPVEFIPHLGLSLTINHQVVDGAPGARFLQALVHGLANIDLLLAL